MRGKHECKKIVTVVFSVPKKQHFGAYLEEGFVAIIVVLVAAADATFKVL